MLQFSYKLKRLVNDIMEKFKNIHVIFNELNNEIEIIDSDNKSTYKLVLCKDFDRGLIYQKKIKELVSEDCLEIIDSLVRMRENKIIK